MGPLFVFTIHTSTFLVTKLYWGEILNKEFWYPALSSTTRAQKEDEKSPGAMWPHHLYLWKGTKGKANTLESEELSQGSARSPHPSEGGSRHLQCTRKELSGARGLGPEKSPVGLHLPSVQQDAPFSPLHAWVQDTDEATESCYLEFNSLQSTPSYLHSLKMQSKGI